MVSSIKKNYSVQMYTEPLKLGAKVLNIQGLPLDF